MTKISQNREVMELKDFLVKAKINTYANIGENGEKILADGAKELVYEDSEWKYRDRYFGFGPFVGEEVVWKNGGIFWSMNYYGRILSDNIDPQKLYAFLRKAMRLVTPNRPFRGPVEFKEEEWMYRDESRGALEDFEGREEIYLKGERVYELKYHGGIIK